ncbi:MAG: PepSY domain-containing protein [Paucibacter sp.]|nr:PepSY domain-containing protein [Roseateles sp.]
MWRYFHLIHRWAGISLGLLVLLWLLSGLVMLFVARPELSGAERQRSLAPLQASAVLKLPGSADGLRLQQQLGRPVFLLQTGKVVQAVDGLSGQPRAPLDEAQARQLAAEYAERLTGGPLRISGLELLARDQWTVYGRFDAQRPLYRVELDGAAGLELYIGQRSGELLLDTTRWERGWNWLGSVTHWLYFTPLRARPALWRQVVLWSSGVAFAMCALGAVLGLQRLRLRRRYASGSVSPYRERWRRWHHLLGLGGGLFLLTWLFSGWLSMGPGGWPGGGGGGAAAQQQQRWRGAELRPEAWTLPADLSGMVELAGLRFQGRPLWLASAAAAPSRLLSTQGQNTQGQVLPGGLSEAELLAAGQALRPELTVRAAAWLHQADSYYYPLRHHPREFPVYRVEFSDDSLYYLDPRLARVALRLDAAGRWSRWLFDGLHKFDFPPIATHGLARDGLIIALSLLGLALAAAGSLLGWRRLRGKPPLKKRSST